MLVTALIFAGCKKEEPKQNLAGEIAGVYTGQLTTQAAIPGFPVNDVILTMTRISDDKVKITTTVPMAENVDIDGQVTKPADKYVLNGSGSVSAFPTVTVNFEGTITTAGEAVINIDASPMAIITYTGKKQ